MIAMLRGTLVEKGLDSAVIECAGVGYQVAVSLYTVQSLPPIGKEARLLTYLQVREDAMQLFGFATAEERKVFELCISVSGIGPKLALATLSGLEPPALAEAIRRGDVARLTKIPGIGKKTAERLVVELRDKFPAVPGDTKVVPQAPPGARPALSGVIGDIVGALCNLGYRPADAERAAELSIKQNEGAALDVILRHALRSLQKE